MPMMSGAFWAKLSAEQQKLMTDLWAANIASYRANAGASQARARKLMEEKGVTFIDPSQAVLDNARKAMQADVATLATAAKLSPDVVRLSEESVNGTA
jgi:TRAP-type C4-dicarboxylate transport system substrate-binding protein